MEWIEKAIVVLVVLVPLVLLIALTILFLFDLDLGYDGLLVHRQRLPPTIALCFRRVILDFESLGRGVESLRSHSCGKF
jgi:hypothetical protein